MVLHYNHRGMFQMILRKIYHNGWLMICLILSSALVVAMIGSIPIYTDGIFQRLLTRDLEDFQVARNVYPGSCNARYNFYTVTEQKIKQKASLYDFFDGEITGRLIPSVGLPLAAHTQQLSLDGLRFQPDDPRIPDPEQLFGRVESLLGLEEHVKMLQGRVFRDEAEEGVYEVIVTEEAMRDLDLLLDRVYTISDKLSGRGNVFKVKVVGVFTYENQRDPFWFNNLSLYRESFLMHHSLFVDEFIRKSSPNFTYSQWFFAFDYYSISLRNISHILLLQEQLEKLAESHGVDWIFPAVSVLEKYLQRAQVLRTMLWFLQIPILLMLSFFIYMISQLIVEYEQNEIALLKSRGASGGQVLLLYLMESLILGALAMVIGPPFGLVICRFLGASNGFMEFVRRTTLSVSLDAKSYLYSLMGVGLFVVTMMIPAILASRTTIVLHKKRRSRGRGGFFWKRFFLDIILLGVSLYGYYSYRTQQQILAVTGVEGQSLPLDPLLFVISVLFILGSGLFILRLYPYAIRLVFWLGRNVWSPVLYATFVHVGRSLGHEQFLMVFLILSLGMGIYNSISARTINRNREDKIRYENGADIIVEPVWPKDEAAAEPSDPSQETFGTSTAMQSVRYVEPPFLPYTELPGIAVATRVYRNSGVSLIMQNGGRDTVDIMGIVPAEFGRVAWFRSDLLASHWYNYLNLIARNPKAFLLSRVLQERHGLKVGDPVYVSWARQMYLDGYIFGFVDFWPTFNPFGAAGPNRRQALIVANLDYIHAKMMMEPYEIWMKKQVDAASRTIYESIAERSLRVENLTDTSQLIVREKNDPMLQGTNGTLTLGFIITMTISAIGFFFYWILSLQSRTLQFGVLRAMGLTQGKVIGMLIGEQLLISGTAVIIGILIGNLSSNLFVPLLQVTSSAAAQVPPFRIIAVRSDFVKVYGVVAGMLLAGGVLFRILISRIRIHQAIKLGEE